VWEFWGKNDKEKWRCSCCWVKAKYFFYCAQCSQYLCKTCKQTVEHQSKTPLVSTLDVCKHTIVWGSDGWVSSAHDHFRKNGFVLIKGVLTLDQCTAVHQDCERIAQQIVGPERNGNRGPGRYSFGNASNSGGMLHVQSFAEHLLGSACSKLWPLLDSVFACGAKPGFVCVGAGGDFVTGGTDTDQCLHADIELGKDFDVWMPPPMISVNFAVEEVTARNGPMRIIPGTQLDRGLAPSPISDEMLHSFLCPMPVGAALVRDVRVLHSGTRNSTQSSRYLPSVEFVSANFRSSNRRDCFPPPRTFPCELVESLDLEPRIKKSCSEIMIAKGRRLQPSYIRA
jgi:hypothetical protein